MKTIPLTQGKFTLVDDDLYEWLSQWKWFAYWHKRTRTYYAVRNSQKSGKRYQVAMARQIMGCKYKDGLIVDHIHHNTLDNRKCNLRLVTCQQNIWNRAKPTKGYKKRLDSKSYHARIIACGRYISLGEYATAKEATDAYLQAKQKYHPIPRGQEEGK